MLNHSKKKNKTCKLIFFIMCLVVFLFLSSKVVYGASLKQIGSDNNYIDFTKQQGLVLNSKSSSGIFIKCENGVKRDYNTAGNQVWFFANNSGNFRNTYYVNNRDTQAGFGYFQFEPSNNNSSFTIDYKKIGYYNCSDEEEEQLGDDKIDIGCRVKFECKKLDRNCNWNPLFMTVSKNFYNGIWYSHMTVDVTFEFFITSTYTEDSRDPTKNDYTKIKLNNTCYTTCSLNNQEAVAYITDNDANGYCVDATNNKFFQKKVDDSTTYFVRKLWFKCNENTK